MASSAKEEKGKILWDKKLNDNVDECCICMENILQSRVTWECGHCYCDECAFKIELCSMCRSLVTDEKDRVSLVLHSDNDEKDTLWCSVSKNAFKSVRDLLKERKLEDLAVFDAKDLSIDSNTPLFKFIGLLVHIRASDHAIKTIPVARRRWLSQRERICKIANYCDAIEKQILQPVQSESSYVLFIREERKKYIGSSMSFGEIAKIINEAWKQKKFKEM